jgi:hypothetical protein
MEHARAFEPLQDDRIYIEKINGPFLFVDKATPAEYGAGLEFAMSRGWLELHESGTFVKLTQSVREFLGERACGCGGAGAPCPACNKVDVTDPDDVPGMPAGFKPDLS